MERIAWLSGLTSQDGTEEFLSTKMGERAPKARALADRLKRRIDKLGQLLGIYTDTGAVGKNFPDRMTPFMPVETFASVKRRVEEARSAAQTRAAATLPATPALTMTTESAQQGPSAPGATAPGATAPGSTTPGAPTPDAMPKWLLPALAVAGAAGVALLLLPMGSSNRGSRARNLDYGSVPSDTREGRMLRGTLRNLETDAHAMRQMLRDDDDLPQWVHAKVQTSADRVSGAQRYLRAKIQAPK